MEKGLYKTMMSLLKDYKRNGLLFFLLLYLVFYTTDAASGYFMIFLRSIGFDTLQMGILTAGASLIALVFQPYVGRMADRARTKNAVLIVALLLAAAFSMMLRLSKAFAYIMMMYTGYLLCRNILHPLTDSIALEHVSEKHMDFGPIRTMGCIGYAMMAVIAGRVADHDPADTFFLYALAALATIAIVMFLPPTAGKQRGRAKLNPMLIFADRKILAYTIFAIVMCCCKSFYHNYFSVYYTGELGGSSKLYGALLSVSAFMEIPIIFSIDRLNRRLGTRRVLILAALVETLRLVATALVSNPNVQIIVQAIFGANNMTLSLSMIIFINAAMKPEAKTTGQATYTACTNVGSLLIGSFLGGAVSNLLGIRPVFLICAAINTCAILVFSVYSRVLNQAAPQQM